MTNPCGLGNFMKTIIILYADWAKIAVFDQFIIEAMVWKIQMD